MTPERAKEILSKEVLWYEELTNEERWELIRLMEKCHPSFQLNIFTLIKAISEGAIK